MEVGKVCLAHSGNTLSPIHELVEMESGSSDGDD